MKGRTPTAAESRHMAAVRELGCFCCGMMGIAPYPDGTLVHHTDGKTKPGAHFRVIPLCDNHHSRYKKTGLHYNLRAWEERWFKQEYIVYFINVNLLGMEWEF